MLEFIRGEIKEITPAYAVIENSGIGYFINISLNTYSQISEKKEVSILLHEIIREDTHLLYGFAETNERELFRQLLSVSGVGANTACMMLSSLNPTELTNAIINGEVNKLKSIKGIGAKSAQRIIVDLKDKLGKEGISEEIISSGDNTIKDEAFSALVTLGFNKKKVGNVLDKILGRGNDLKVEDLIKKALQEL